MLLVGLSSRCSDIENIDDDVTRDDRLTAELQAFVRSRLAAHEYPRAIEYVDSLPLTASGKLIRRELRARG